MEDCQFFMKENRTRIRNFAFILYEESSSPEWKYKLSDMCIPCFVVYHDKDINPDGEIKKPHYHVLCSFQNPVGTKKIEGIINNLGAANGQYQEVACLRSYARYLCHLDNPDKFQYSIDSVLCFGGTDYKELISSTSDRVNLVKNILIFCKQHKVHSYSMLIDFCLEKQPDWFNILCSSNYGNIVKDYIKSSYWTNTYL